MDDRLPSRRPQERLTITDRAAFVRANTRRRAIPLVPEISLYVADEAVPLWQKTEEELGEMGLPAPFWAFAWAGGQALARYILDNPALVAGRRVLDFASGSGLVAIAAAKAGAQSVEASEIDDFAISAIALNAEANNANVQAICADLIGRDERWDVVLAADVCYEREMAVNVLAWLASLSARGAEIRIGDPGRSYLPKERIERITKYDVPVTRDLEDAEIKNTGVWRLLPARSSMR
ncbi:MAG TPA: 50S ribosomal protein L11 methyltransferase [Xanthobacteraceae bacterium]|nr:50S ribosomal protein L11 methyltransferase [Xanthobacteraceae bacterium]